MRKLPPTFESLLHESLSIISILHGKMYKQLANYLEVVHEVLIRVHAEFGGQLYSSCVVVLYNKAVEAVVVCLVFGLFRSIIRGGSRTRKWLDSVVVGVVIIIVANRCLGVVLRLWISLFLFLSCIVYQRGPLLHDILPISHSYISPDFERILISYHAHGNGSQQFLRRVCSQ